MGRFGPVSSLEPLVHALLIVPLTLLPIINRRVAAARAGALARGGAPRRRGRHADRRRGLPRVPQHAAPAGPARRRGDAGHGAAHGLRAALHRDRDPVDRLVRAEPPSPRAERHHQVSSCTPAAKPFLSVPYRTGATSPTKPSLQLAQVT